MRETTLYDARDRATTHIAGNGGTIYTWRGKAVACLVDDKVYSWRGTAPRVVRGGHRLRGPWPPVWVHRSALAYRGGSLPGEVREVREVGPHCRSGAVGALDRQVRDAA